MIPVLALCVSLHQPQRHQHLQQTLTLNLHQRSLSGNARDVTYLESTCGMVVPDVHALSLHVPPQCPPPPPPAWPRRDTTSPTQPSAPTLPPQVLVLREAVANLTTRCTAITERFDAIEARIDSLATQNATTERTLASLVESHQAIMATVTTFSEKLKALTSRFEMVCDRMFKEPSQCTTENGTTSVSLPPSAFR